MKASEAGSREEEGGEEGVASVHHDAGMREKEREIALREQKGRETDGAETRERSR